MVIEKTKHTVLMIHYGMDTPSLTEDVIDGL